MGPLTTIDFDPLANNLINQTCVTPLEWTQLKHAIVAQMMTFGYLALIIGIIIGAGFMYLYQRKKYGDI